MTRKDVPFSCTCGQVHGIIHDVSPSAGNHLKCYCKSCQAAARVLGDENNLDEWGGTGVFQTVPSKVEFLAGADHLGVLKLSPKGILRWYATCCNAPLFTMPDAGWFPIAGLNMARVSPDDAEPFGRVIGIHQAEGARGAPADLKTFGIKRAFFRLSWRALKARLRGDSSAPFFNKAGQVSVTPRVLTLEQRKAATPE